MLNMEIMCPCVAVTPHIDREGLDLEPTVVLNRTLVLNCHANGIPNPEIVWLRNGELLDTNVHPNVYLSAGRQQLRLESAAAADSAVYRCMASNKAGQDSVDFAVAVHSKAMLLLSVIYR